MSNLKTHLNIYWSLRRYLYEQFPTTTTYYNPVLRPSLVGEKFLIVNFQEERMGKMSYSFPRIFCISKSDPELIKLNELVSSVIEKFTSPSSGMKLISLYDKATNALLGSIEVKDVTVRPVLAYEEGFIQRGIDLTLRYIVEKRHS